MTLHVHDRDPGEPRVPPTVVKSTLFRRSGKLHPCSALTLLGRSLISPYLRRVLRRSLSEKHPRPHPRQPEPSLSLVRCYGETLATESFSRLGGSSTASSFLLRRQEAEHDDSGVSFLLSRVRIDSWALIHAWRRDVFQRVLHASCMYVAHPGSVGHPPRFWGGFLGRAWRRQPRRAPFGWEAKSLGADYSPARCGACKDGVRGCGSGS